MYRPGKGRDDKVRTDSKGFHADGAEPGAGGAHPVRIQSETQEQRQLIQWCRTRPELQFIFHIPNESIGGQGWIVRNRQMGVKGGVPDLMLPIPANGYHGLFIEMKAQKGRLSNEQKKWIDCLNAFGYLAIVAYGWEDAKCQILHYLNLPDL